MIQGETRRFNELLLENQNLVSTIKYLYDQLRSKSNLITILKNSNSEKDLVIGKYDG